VADQSTAGIDAREIASHKLHAIPQIIAEETLERPDITAGADKATDVSPSLQQALRYSSTQESSSACHKDVHRAAFL
jgi:hypothetical protein